MITEIEVDCVTKTIRIPAGAPTHTTYELYQFLWEEWQGDLIEQLPVVIKERAGVIGAWGILLAWITWVFANHASGGDRMKRREFFSAWLPEVLRSGALKGDE